MKPNIIIIGKCKNILDQIKETIKPSFDFNIIEKQFSSNMSDMNYDESVIAIFICCGQSDRQTDINMISFIHSKLPYAPLFAILDNEIEREYLHELYKHGIMEHIYSPQDLLDIEIINRKIELLFGTYKWREQLAREKIKNNNYSITLSSNMKTYIELLDLMKISYLILNTNGIIIENNEYLNSIFKTPNLIGEKLEKWIDKCSIDTFKYSFENMINGELYEDVEIKIFKENNQNTVSAWLRISGNSINYNGHKILILAKDISNLKNAEYNKYLQQQKKRDLIKQNISTIRQQLQVLNNATI